MKDLSVKITLFYCSNSISAEEISQCVSQLKEIELNTISLPCSGKINLLYLLKTIEKGSEGALLMTCKFGECKFIQGNFRAIKRVESVDDLIFETGLGRGHVKCIQLEDFNKIEFITKEISNYCKLLRAETRAAKVTILGNILK